MRANKRMVGLLLLAVALAFFFTLLFYKDNKYQTPPPYGLAGVIDLTQEDLSRGQPLFLIDGWLLTDSRVTDLPTFIGQFPTLQRGDTQASPHGEATYRMTLRYSGEPVEAAISFPQLFNRHTITMDDRVLSRGEGGVRASFLLTPGDHLLTVNTRSRQGYYSGMYHPPALSATGQPFSALLVQCVAYSFAFFTSLALAVFTLVLWRSVADQAAFWFGLLCCSYSGYLSYYFVRLFGLPLGEHWYLLQSAALYLLCFCVVRLISLTGGIESRKAAIWPARVMGAVSVVLLVLALAAPRWSWALRLHGVGTDLYYIFTFCVVLLLGIRGRKQTGWEHDFTLLACTAFGMGLLLNLFFSNRFEPILFFWQFEWCGLFLVLLFGGMMTARNKRVLAENEAFANHMEILVEKRTEELSNLLRERKAFFAEMSHDLKAPIVATKAFIQAIRENNTAVDGELLRYIDEVELKQQEMTRRVQGLNIFNKMDAIIQPKEPVSVCALLEMVYREYHMSAEVASVHLTMELPDMDGYLFAQPEKLHILFENLFFNALRATPQEGKIALAGELDADSCHLSVADTGRGIRYEDLPHIFERFYVGKENKDSGTGLGLSIVKSIVEDMGGEISVSSKLGQGTVFYIDLPLMNDRLDR